MYLLSIYILSCPLILFECEHGLECPNLDKHAQKRKTNIIASSSDVLNVFMASSCCYENWCEYYARMLS